MEALLGGLIGSDDPRAATLLGELIGTHCRPRLSAHGRAELKLQRVPLCRLQATTRPVTS